mgnify:FL=1
MGLFLFENLTINFCYAIQRSMQFSQTGYILLIIDRILLEQLTDTKKLFTQEEPLEVAPK